MLNSKLKVIYLRGIFLKGFLKFAIIYNGNDYIYEDNCVLDEYNLLSLTSGKESTYMIEASSLKKYNLKGNINENKAITKHT